MSVRLGGFFVSFNHNGDVSYFIRGKRFRTESTTCYIKDNVEAVASATVTRLRGDQPNRIAARRFALEKAVASLKVEERAVVMADYEGGEHNMRIFTR